MLAVCEVFVQLIVWAAGIHAFHFGNCRQPEARKCKLRFYRTTCGAVGVRRGMPTCRGEKRWPLVHGCNLYADGGNNVPGVVGHIAFLFHAHAENIWPP